MAKCHDCGKVIAEGEGISEYTGVKDIIWCQDCYDRSDNSSYEDRACGNRAQEDSYNQERWCEW